MTTAILHSDTAGELLAASLTIPSRQLEDLLEALAEAPFPLNPELDHSRPGFTTVRFPLYEHQIAALHDILRLNDFACDLLQVNSVDLVAS